MELFELVVGIVGTALGVVGCAPLAVSYTRWKQRRASATFEHAIAPILHDLQTCIKKNQRAEQRRMLVRDVVRLASQATYRRDRPDPDEASRDLARTSAACRFCGERVAADATGSCEDCGLGARHWCCAPDRKHLVTASTSPP
jgi:hypothetical protein